MQKMRIEKLVNKIVQDTESPDDYENCCEVIGSELSNVFNEISIHLASSFLDGKTSYDDADFAMNKVWSAMLNYIMEKDIPLIEPCYSIYCAFDEGEYDHRDGSDPVEKYTKPILKLLLKRNA